MFVFFLSALARPNRHYVSVFPAQHNDAIIILPYLHPAYGDLDLIVWYFAPCEHLIPSYELTKYGLYSFMRLYDSLWCSVDFPFTPTFCSLIISISYMPSKCSRKCPIFNRHDLFLFASCPCTAITSTLTQSESVSWCAYDSVNNVC